MSRSHVTVLKYKHFERVSQNYRSLTHKQTPFPMCSSSAGNMHLLHEHEFMCVSALATHAEVAATKAAAVTKTSSSCMRCRRQRQRQDELPPLPLLREAVATAQATEAAATGWTTPLPQRWREAAAADGGMHTPGEVIGVVLVRCSGIEKRGDGAQRSSGHATHEERKSPVQLRARGTGALWKGRWTQCLKELHENSKQCSMYLRCLFSWE